jgi:hypothetical protein
VDKTWNLASNRNTCRMSTWTFQAYHSALRASIAQCISSILIQYSRELKHLFVNDEHWAGVLALAKTRGASAHKPAEAQRLLEEAPLLLAE